MPDLLCSVPALSTLAIVICLASVVVSSSVNQKLICTCLLDGLHDSTMLTCANSYKLVISDAYLFDYGQSAHQDNCSLPNIPDKYTNIRADLASICFTGSSCLLKQSDLINIKDDNSKMDCLAVFVIWNCLKIIKKEEDANADFKFTYIFYMITLICSSVCIIAGSLLIFRKFIIMRRRNNQARSNRSSDQQSSTSQNFFNSIWTTSPFDPPAYENAYNSSLPISHSLPPSYDETNVKNKISNEITNQHMDEPELANTTQSDNVTDNSMATQLQSNKFNSDNSS